MKHRVVVGLTTDGSLPDNVRGLPLYEEKRVYQPRYPAAGQPPSDVAYQAPFDQVYRRHPRQDSVIYIE